MLNQSRQPKALNKVITLAGSGATEKVNIFKVHGAVRVKKIEGKFLSDTTLTNMTDCHLNVNDATADYPITKTTTCTMSSAIVGSIAIKIGAVTDVLYLKEGTVGGVIEAATAQLSWEFVVIEKSGADTYIQFVYTTTDAPIDATMQWYVEYEPIVSGYLTA